MKKMRVEMLSKLKPKSEFSRNVLTLMTGTTIAQAIPIAISPILTRIYTPEDFGLFALYMSLASLVSVIATGRYEMAIMLPKKDEDAVGIVVLSLVIAFFVSFISLLIVFFFNAQITQLLGDTQLSSWLYFIPITVLLTGMYQSFNYWFNRKKHYKRLAMNRVTQSVTLATSNLSMGFGGFGTAGLIFSSVLAQSVATGVMAKVILREDYYRIGSVSKLKIFALASKYSKFPKYNLPNAIIDSLRFSGISILIAKFFTTASLGQFSLAWKMIQIPISLIGNSLSQVFFQKVATAKRSDLDRILKKFILHAFIISAPIFLLLYFFGVDLFMFAFGENWRLSGEIVTLLAPWLFLNFITAPMANIFIVLNKQEIVLMIAIIYMVVPITLLILFHDIGFLNILNIISICMSTILLFSMLLCLFYTKKEKNDF